MVIFATFLDKISRIEYKMESCWACYLYCLDMWLNIDDSNIGLEKRRFEFRTSEVNKVKYR